MIERLNQALTGRYRVERELGAGGMATVYLATDVKHSRPVAVKVLHPELAAVVGAERFLGEIETTANLQHPHVLPLFDSGEADGFLFYVMPYVEGESLREKLDRERQLPVEQAVEIARKVASALQHAHERGVVHRDIKPANILLSEGEPLVADFGIALAVSTAGSGRITETGLSLGTPHYMSPEQASGDRSLDPRSDVYALGCVLYEMLAGEPPFPGPTPQAVLARILTSTPQRVTATRHTVPRHVDAAVAKALEKLPADRFGLVAAFRTALEDPDFRHVPTEAPEAETSAAATGAGAGGRGRGRWALAGAAAALAAVAFVAGRAGVPEPERPVARFRVSVPEGVTFVSACCGPAQALSPDGEWLVFVGIGGGSHSLHRRRLGRLEAEPIPGTEGASIPFFSPDGRWIGFHADGRLRKVPMTGGPAVPIAEVETAHGASWGDDDVIVLGGYDGALSTVPASGGTPTPVPGTEDAGYIHPWMLPGGGAALARIDRPGISDQESRVVAVDLGTGAADTLGFGTRAAYASGYLLLSGADGTLLAQPFDPEERRTTGPAVAILDGVATAGPGIGEFALSADGDLAYLTGGLNLAESLILHGPGGEEEIPLPEPGNLEDPSFSPDGRRIAVRVAPNDQEGQIWIWDRDQRTQQLLTVEGQENFSPVWTPDGTRIAFASEREDTPPRIYWQPADGSGGAEPLLEGEPRAERGAVPNQFSPDGASLLFTVRGDDDADVGLLDLADGTVRWLVETAANDYQGQISPDGRWLAYTSERSGQPEVYVQSLGGGGRTQVSTGGGSSPRWAPDGSTLYYATGEGRPVIATSVSTDGGFRILSRATAFEGIDDLNVPGSLTWDVSPDGEEFLYIGRGGAGGVEGFVWVLNWPEIVRGMEGGGAP